MTVEDPPGCEFCDVLAGRAEGSPTVFSDEWTVVTIGRRQPTGAGYCLVVLRHHVADLAELPDAELVGLWRTVGLVQWAIRVAFGPSGTTVMVNDGPPGQPVGHLHVHVVPRWTGDGYPCSAGNDESADALLIQADRLRSVLQAAFEELSRG